MGESIMINARIDMRVNQELKAKAEKASALLGLKSVTEYVVKLIDEDASKVIAQHEGMTVKNDIFDRFMSACEEAKKPNKALRDAAAYTKKQGIK
jgi:uncharacterized protein (DUF1778 family)